MDQKPLAEDVSSKINYEFSKQFLIKPLEPIMVKKVVSTPIPAKEQKGDVDGVEATDYDDVKEEIKDVESRYKKGIILKVPQDYSASVELAEKKGEFSFYLDLHVGDTVVYEYAKDFDLIKDTKILSLYDIIAVIR